MFKKHKNKEKLLASESRIESPARSFFPKRLPWKASESKEVVEKRDEVKNTEPRQSSTVSTLASNQGAQLPPSSKYPTLSDDIQKLPQPNSNVLGPVDATANAESESPVQRTWKGVLSGKGMTILKIIGEIAGVSAVDVLGPVEEGTRGHKPIRQFFSVFSGLNGSLMDENGSNIPEEMKDSLMCLCRNLAEIATNVEKGNIRTEDARWRVTNLLQMVLLENNLSGHISSDVISKMENPLTSRRDKTKEDNFRQAVTNLPFTNAAYNDYASTSHRRVTCLDGTRQGVLKEMGEWVSKSESNIYVLFGLAGIGKSTIAQTVAKSADSIGLLGASFFFSREEADHRIAKLFFTTIAFQLCIHDEEFADAIGSVLGGKGKAATSKLPLEQLEILILEPLSKLSPRKVVVVVDALDECDDEEGPTILMGLRNLVQRLPSFKVVLTTRPTSYVHFHLEGQRSHKIFHLHTIDDMVVDDDIRRYLKHHLSIQAVRTHFMNAKEDWSASDTEIESLVQAAGRLFIIASTSVLFILDKAAHDPEYRMKVLLKAITHNKMPLDVLNNFYTVVLRSALFKGCDSHAVGRYQKVIGAIMVIQIPLGIRTLAKLIDCRPRDIHRVLERLQPVILVDEASDTPHVYHKSFPDYIQDSQRCVDDDLRVDPKAHHTQLAICCFRTMTQCLKQNILELGDPTCFMRNDDALEEQGFTNDQLQEKIPLDLQYACLHFANHIEGADTEDMNLIKELQAFANDHLLSWIETLSWIGKLDSAYWALHSTRKHMKLAPLDVHRLLGDGLRFIGRFYFLIRKSALHTYHSALPLTPTKTSLYNRYSKKMSFCRAQGGREEWDALISTLDIASCGNIGEVTFSHDNTMFACHMQSKLTIHDATAGIQVGSIKGEQLAIACNFSKAAASEDNIITLYCVKGAMPVATINASCKVRHIEHSPDGSRLLAMLTDGTISVWDTEEGKLMVASTKWKGQSISVISSNVATGVLAITPDNATSIFVVNVSTCDIICTMDCSVLVKEALSLSLAKFCGDGSRLACLVVTDESSTLILWNSKDGTFIGAAQNAGKNVSISKDGSLLTTWEGTALKLWDGNSGDPLVLLETLNLRFEDEITSVAFGQNDLLAAASLGDDQVFLYDIKSRLFLPALRFDAATAISLSSDCARLAIGDSFGTVRLWDVSSIKAQDQLSRPTALSFAHDCSWLASGHEDGSIKLWDTSDTTIPVSTHKGHSKKITVLAFNVAGSEFASGSGDGFIKLWDAKEDVQNGILECSDEEISAITMSGQVLIAATETRITLYDIKTCSVTDTLDQSNTSHLKLSDNHSLLATANSDQLIVWDIKKRMPLAAFRHTYNGFGRMSFTDGDSKLAVQDNDFVKLFNIHESNSDNKGKLDGIIVSDSQEVVQLGLGPCWHGIPVWVDEQGYIVGFFPQQTKSVRVHDLLYVHDLVECGSSMIAYGHRNGPISVISTV